jgi:hypothetical protein
MRFPFRRLVFAVLSLALIAAPFVAAPAAWAASPAMEEAQKAYDAAKFDDAIALLRDALGNGQITGSEVVSARALMARCMVKSGKRIEAKQAFKTVLRADPGFKLDTVTVPPDEVEVFDLAAKEIQQEQIEAGQRIPASLGFIYGVGSGDNKDFAKIQHSNGGDDKMDSKPEFGVSVRFPLRPRLSLDLELSRFRATGKDTVSDPNTVQFETSAIPMVVSLYYTAITGNKFHLNLFAGGGPMVASRASIDINFFTVRLQIADEKVGTFLHGGVEGEYMVMPKLSLTGRVEGRYANASDLFKDSTLELYGNPDGALKNQKVDFSGYGAFIGLRGYIGY